MRAGAQVPAGASLRGLCRARDRGYPAGVPRVTVTPEQVEARRAELVALIEDFRRHGAALVAAAAEAGVLAAYDRCEEYDDEVVALGSRWWLHLHDPHGRFESRIHGAVVEAHLYRPHTLDAGFLLEFARTSGAHPEALALCRAGFPDMAAVLDLLEPGWDDLDATT